MLIELVRKNATKTSRGILSKAWYKIDVEGYYSIVLEDWVPTVYAPMELFKGKRVVSMLDFVEWINGRVFPPERVGANNCSKNSG